ncbi:APC family permease [Actinoplanes sp. NBRC 103695]|uniref:APC family permease n=1 Tax=Actinoplanes sp. NBRC 103695 TaxID=3032202 RepID=UPI0024A1EE9A|nr:APC family permease [Actinoplanes sp. NBRC 103695]GLY96548.1 amino acid permease [Actinoplanes sp. NBRC 103695]
MTTLKASLPPTGGIEQALGKAKLGVLPMIFNTMSAAAPLTVIAGGATAGFAITGAKVIPFAYLAVAAVLALFAVGFLAMARKIVNAGAFYTYVSHGLGKVAGVGAAFVAVAAYNVMQVGLYGGFGPAAKSFFSQFEIGALWWVCAGGAWAVIAVLGWLRIDFNAWVLAALVVGEIVIALVFAWVQLRHPAGGVVTVETLTPGSSIGDIVLGAVVAIAGFVGVEINTVYSEEARQPGRTVPRATYLGIAFIGILYAFCSWAMSVATGPDAIVQRSIDESSELTFTLSSGYLPLAVIIAGRLLFATSLFAALLSFHHTAARYHFALGREGVFWRFLGRTSRRTGAPIYGSVLQSLIGFTGIALFVINGWDPFTQMFFWLTVLGGFGVLLLMTITSIAVVRYFSNRANRPGVGRWRGTVAPSIAALVLGTIVVYTLAEFHQLIGVDEDDPVRWMLPAGYALAAVVGMVWALILRQRRPDVYEQIGLGANRSVTA